MKKQDIKITDLKLWDENPRFPEEYFAKSEEELIEYLFNKKGEKEKIIELAKSFIDNFELTPWERLIVWDDYKNKIVLEGNRRLMVYKLLLNPNLIEDPKIKKIFEGGKNIARMTVDFSVDCLITKDREKGLRYVEIKHLEAGYKSWGTSERNNFKLRRGKKNENVIIKAEIDKRVKTLDVPQEIKDKILGQGFVTTFDRVVTTSSAKNYFGYEVKEDKLIIKDSDFDKKLKQIIWNVLNGRSYTELFDEQRLGDKDKLNSRTLNKNENIEKYLQSIDSKSIQKAEKEIESSIEETENLFGEKEVTINTEQGRLIKTPRNQKELNKLFGGTLALEKGDVNDIYRDVLDLYLFYLQNKGKLSGSFPTMIRMALRLLVESATSNNDIAAYVNKNYENAKKVLTKDQKTTLSNNSINGKQSLIQLLQSGAHNYKNSANFEQTIAMSIIIGAMLKITHSKK